MASSNKQVVLLLILHPMLVSVQSGCYTIAIYQREQYPVTCKNYELLKSLIIQFYCKSSLYADNIMLYG